MIEATDSTRAGNSQNHRRLGIAQLVFCAVTIGTVWCIGLPYLASRQSMRAYTQWLDERGIDPSAMYYTELPAMDRILERLERTR